MIRVRLSRAIVILASILFVLCQRAGAQAPTITKMVPTSGPVGSSVTIIGSNYGSTQGSSTVSLNGINAVVTSWGVDGFVAAIPSGATSGTLSVTVNGQQVNSPFFTVTRS